MITKVEFKKEHMEYLLQFQTEEYRKAITHEMMTAMEKENMFTGVNAEGEVMVCGGVRKLWEGRGELWALFNYSKRSYCLSMHKHILNIMNEANLKRIEMVVYCENTLGHKLAKVLGFKVETERLTAYRPDGGDVAMYVRIK